MHSETHIANGMCSALAALCYHLAKEITIDGCINATRVTFLIEAMYALASVAQNFARFSQETNNIFRLMPYVASTADIFQSVLMMFIFDETPTLAIRVKQVASGIFRYFRHEGSNASFIEKLPVGLIGLLLVIPLLASNFNAGLSPKDIIADIVHKINACISALVEDFKKINFDNEAVAGSHKENVATAQHLKNKHILAAFSAATPVPFVPTQYLTNIYDAVIRGEHNVAKTLNIAEHPTFVYSNLTPTLKQQVHKNYPVMTKYNEQEKSASYLSADPREWVATSNHKT